MVVDLQICSRPDMGRVGGRRRVFMGPVKLMMHSLGLLKILPVQSIKAPAGISRAGSPGNATIRFDDLSDSTSQITNFSFLSIPIPAVNS